jgi:hypothetical protein
VTLAFVIGLERQPGQFMPFGAIAVRAGHAGAAATAGMRALPGSLGMVLADPAAILASEAIDHANRSAPAWVSFT